MAIFKRRTKADVVDKQNFSRGVKKNGKPRKSGTIVTFKDGDCVTLLTPSGKAEKFAGELRDGVRVTNDGVIKRDEYGFPLNLTAEQRAYRSGYLDARKDNAKVYNAKRGGK